MHRKRWILGLSVLAGALGLAVAGAQPPIPLWAHTYGGTGLEKGYAVKELPDGGFIFSGETQSFGAGSYDVYLVRTDANGDTLWTRAYGGASYEFGYGVCLAPEGGFLAVGVTTSFGAGGRDGLAVRVDADGNLLWMQSYGGASQDAIMDVYRVSEDTYVLTGTSYSLGPGTAGMWVLMIDDDGQVIWEQSHGGDGADTGWRVLQTSDGGFIVGGFTTSFGAGSKDLWLVKLDSEGGYVWDHTYGGTGDDRGYGLAIVPGGGYLLTGYTDSFGAGGTDIYLVMADDEGLPSWTRTYGGPGNEIGYAVITPCGGGILLAGSTTSIAPGDVNTYVIHTDTFGDTLWTTTYAVAGDDWAEALLQTQDGGFALGGSADPGSLGNRDLYLVRLEGSGPTPVLPTIEDPPQADVWTRARLLGVQPSLVQDQARICFSLPGTSAIRDLLGAGTHSVSWDRRSDTGQPVPSGPYLYELRVGPVRLAGRLVVVD
jgi:hypothetical protein